ncbi:hypothetical protein HAX54_051173 [Datura stramonium]|uniref:Transcription repressor n=1 Tax=Datura stramonium TaxID=4076 RepID=A0ABS8WQY7_DATST|nr:hypothetical protein [Datura stramonium]
MFKSSFGYCKSKNISDDIDNNNNKKPVFYPQNHKDYRLVELFSPKPRPFPSMFTHKCPEKCLFPSSGVGRNFLQAAASVYCHNSTSDMNGRKCPPASPIFPHEYSEKCNFNSMTKYYQKNSNKKKKNKKKFKKMTNSKIKKFNFDQEFPNFDYKGLFSSDEDSEDEEDDNNTLFSSRSFTNSDSSEYSLRRKPRRRRRRKEAASGGVKGSLAVVKKSRDPYGDFRDSMLEMIMENQIFGGKELEDLLECFLKLNSQHHHGIIIDVFTEICEALFSG